MIDLEWTRHRTRSWQHACGKRHLRQFAQWVSLCAARRCKRAGLFTRSATTQHRSHSTTSATAHSRQLMHTRIRKKKRNLVVNTAVCKVSDRNPGSPLLRNSTLELKWERRIGAARVDEKPRKL